MKKTLSTIALVLTLIVTCMPVQTYAADMGEDISSNPIINVGDNLIFLPFKSHRPIDDEPITQNGVSWDQTEDSYRIWVQNDTSETMTVTIRYDKWWGTGTRTMTVPAGKGRGYTNNDAHHGEHRVSFSTPSGYLAGSVSVRVSDEVLR